MDRVKVLYIGGTGRTGSTVLEKVLAQSPGVFAGGELTFLWRFRDTGLCSCGAPILECPVWTAVFDDAFGGFGKVDPGEMMALRRRFRSVHLPLMVSRRATRWFMRRLGTFPAALECLYRSMATTTASRLVVDSSKEPHYSYILASQPGLDVRFLHLVRDPRAVAFSWRRQKPQRGLPGGGDLDRRSPSVASAYFDVSNVAAELMWGRKRGAYLRMRYEDFVADPQAALGQIEELVEEPLHLDLRNRVVEIGTTHSAWGNPNRFDTGELKIASDEEWREGLGWSSTAVVTTMTLPLLARYGYPVWPRA